ncbi:hypothetical protein BC939DRAFT_470298 [Gamsiella multidivaricata]|uniref:uncharacterized protein n=1 Tax=Gamsiella multidivaricata TaxID=101098 RepID=UPI0022200912|nr:uncharacterized protein BC939DRAFT_470298 [Gamsiella multidivaricata]KAI7816109.1 hypothetical protein BC939DRAFT_470298 [Gamsiella multidivaricata]
MLWILWLYLCVSRILGQGTRMATTGREVYLLGIAQSKNVESKTLSVFKLYSWISRLTFRQLGIKASRSHWTLSP